MSDSPPPAAGTDSEPLQLVSFEIGTEEYAIPILAVREINRVMSITRVPSAPASVEGVINLRGHIIPVVDLRKRFAQDAPTDTADVRIVVVEIADPADPALPGRVLGFLVDRVNEVLRLGRDIIDPAPGITGTADTDFIDGVGKLEDRLLILLNLDRLFAETRLPDELPQAA